MRIIFPTTMIMMPILMMINNGPYFPHKTKSPFLRGFFDSEV